MFGTIETIHNKLEDKLKSLSELTTDLKICVNNCLKIGKEVDIGYNINNIYINLVDDDVKQLERDYRVSVVSILTEYYSKNTISHKEDKCTQEYYQIIISENFASKTDELVIRIKNILDKLTMELKKIEKKEIDMELYSETMLKLQKIMKKINIVEQIDINILVNKLNYEICKCGNRMVVIPKMSQLKCDNCGKIKTLYGTVFEDNQFYNQEGQKTKHGTYDPNRHFKFWMDRIQAKENKTFNKDHITKIEYVINRDGYSLQDIDCDTMRRILKETQLTKYNDHVPLLLKRFTGKSPPQLTYGEMRIFAIKFNKIMSIYQSIISKNDEKIGNRPYYPFFIRKIAEQVFKNNNEKLKLLEYIHLQSGDTITRHDVLYKQICDRADPEDELVYNPTDYSDRRV
jgi:hypothetical protein